MSIGPRILAAGNIVGWGGPYSISFSLIREQGLTLFQEQVNDEISQGAGEDLVDMDPEELRVAIRAYLDKGPDFIKYGGSAHFARPALIGFSPESQKKQIFGGTNIGNPDPGKVLRSFNWNTNFFTQYNNDGLTLDKSFASGFEGQFLNYWSFFVGGGRSRDAYDDLDTRGGPPIVKPGAWFTDTFVGTDSRKRVRLSADAHFSGNREGGFNRNYNFSFNYQPKPQVQMTISTGITDGHDVAQWIQNEDVTGDGVTDYIYGELNRNVVSMTARGTYAFTRDMTLEVYLQPFVAVGDYYNIRRLAQPKSFEFEPVTIDNNPDFNNKSFRSNVVFRWEYRRGSTLYLVYNVSNSEESRPGRVLAVPGPAYRLRRRRHAGANGEI